MLQPIIIKKIKFCKKSIEVIYNDIPKENVNFNKIEIILENFINNHKHNDIKENVSIIRTIMKDCEEKLLIISYQNEIVSEFVKYENTNLLLYE